jgi:hypothetical protein
VQEFNMIANTLPNPEMSPIGLRRVQNELIGLTDLPPRHSASAAGVGRSTRRSWQRDWV